MRRNDREVTDREAILNIMERCDVCHVAFRDGEYPYVVPLNFGVMRKDDQFTLFFHTAKEGKKLELLQKHSKVAFSMSCEHRLQEAEVACGYTMRYESVCGTGIMTLMPEEDKIMAMNSLMRHYRKGEDLPLEQKQVNAVLVWQLSVTKISGKASR